MQENSGRLGAITIRFKEDAREQLKAAAGSERRSLANMVEKIVADYLEAQNGAGAPRALKKTART